MCFFRVGPFVPTATFLTDRTVPARLHGLKVIQSSVSTHNVGLHTRNAYVPAKIEKTCHDTILDRSLMTLPQSLG